MAVRIQFRRGTSTEWSSVNPVLAEGELGFESDTKIIKFGDGVTAWNTLPVAAAGDITAVIAGTGLTGGATSGQATLAIDPTYVITADAINAAGDLIVGAGPDTYARLPIGPNGSVLVADSSQSVGVRWAAASSSSGAVVPTGTILPYGGTTAPAGGFLLCNGQAVSRSEYAELFNVINIAYGAGNGSSTFNIPDLRGRIPAGFNTGDSNFGVMGASTGRASTVLVGGTPAPSSNEVQLPGHAHGITFTGQGEHDHTGVNTGIQDTNHSHTGSTSGGDHTHQVPYFRNTATVNASSAVGVVGTAGDVTAATKGTGSHSHGVSTNAQSADHRHSISITSSGTHNHAATISHSLPASSTIPHIQPSVVVNYIIKT